MSETIDKLRTELSESMGKRSELASRAEHYQEVVLHFIFISSQNIQHVFSSS